MASSLARALPTAAMNSNADASTRAKPRIAYIMSRFPKLTETFVLDEILEHERCGVTVEVFPLWRESARIVHPEARPIVARAHFLPTLDVRILLDNLRCFGRMPRRYLGALATLIRANRRSLRFLVAALAIFPKAVSFAERMHALGVAHVHAHFASHPAAAAFVVGRLAGIPWSFTAHGSDLHREQSMLAEKVAEASFVVAISEYNRRFILDHVGDAFAEKIRVIHCGIDPQRFDRSELEPAAGASDATGADGSLRIVCVGTLHEVKGQSVLLDACAGLDAHDVPWQCHLIGDGPDRAALERRAAALGIADRIVFHGAREREGVRMLLATMDVAVAPSVPTRDGRREGIPVVLMEAAACGLPLVASRLSGIPEIVEDGESGLLVEPGDRDGLTQALARIAREPETRARFGRAARSRVEEAFDLERNGRTLREQFFGGSSE